MIFLETFLNYLRKRRDDDGYDKLHYLYSAMIYVVWTFFITARQLGRKAIQCWVPKQFTSAWEEYVEVYCYIKNTYYLPFNETIPKYAERQGNELLYYQWISVLLSIYCLLCILPLIMWRVINWFSAYPLKGLITMCQQIESVENRKATVNAVAGFFETQVTFGTRWRRINGSSWLSIGRNGSHLLSVYLLIKLLYLLSAGVQFMSINWMFGKGKPFWAFRILARFTDVDGWFAHHYFPRSTMCDFTVRADSGDSRNYTVQCVLPLNMLYEKLFTFLYFWNAALVIICAVRILYWLCFYSPMSQLRFVRSFVGHEPQASTASVRSFVSDYLNTDGVFALRLISINSNDMVVSQLLRELWARFILDPRFTASVELNGRPYSMPKEGLPVKKAIRAAMPNRRGKTPTTQLVDAFGK